MKFKEIVEQGFNEVIVQSYGYDEGRINPTYQPFKTKRDIVFHIARFDNDPELAYLVHPTFILKDCEDELDYEIRDGKCYLDDPNIMADIEY